MFAINYKGENIGRSLRQRYGDSSEPSWQLTGQAFHRTLRPRRFTSEHAREAGYEKRSRRYSNRKFYMFGHRNPLEYSGEVKRLVQTAKIKSRRGTGQEGNKGGVMVFYPGARKLNFKNPRSNINMRLEFTTVTEREANLLGEYFKNEFERRFYS